MREERFRTLWFFTAIFLVLGLTCVALSLCARPNTGDYQYPRQAPGLFGVVAGVWLLLASVWLLLAGWSTYVTRLLIAQVKRVRELEAELAERQGQPLPGPPALGTTGPEQPSAGWLAGSERET